MLKKSTKKLVLAALFMALGLLLPFFTGQIPSIGNKLLPMHLPVLLCGFVCGWEYGLTIGFILPVFRSLLFGMPPMYPTAVAMSFELAVYGLVTGYLYTKLPKKNLSVIFSLVTAMLCGRIIWGLVSVILYGLGGNSFAWKMFVAGAFFNAIPGIIIQLVIIPAIIIALKRAELI